MAALKVLSQSIQSVAYDAEVRCINLCGFRPAGLRGAVGTESTRACVGYHVRGGAMGVSYELLHGDCLTLLGGG